MKFSPTQRCAAAIIALWSVASCGSTANKQPATQEQDVSVPGVGTLVPITPNFPSDSPSLTTYLYPTHLPSDLTFKRNKITLGPFRCIPNPDGASRRVVEVDYTKSKPITVEPLDGATRVAYQGQNSIGDLVIHLIHEEYLVTATFVGQFSQEEIRSFVNGLTELSQADFLASPSV